MNDILAAQAEASGASFLALADDGTVLSYNARFAHQWGVPPSVLATGKLATLLEWLVVDGSDSGRMLAELLVAKDPAPGGELFSPDGGAASYSSVAIRGGTARVWAFFDTSSARRQTSGLRDAANLIRMFDAHADGVILEIDIEACIIGLWARDDAHFDESDVALQGRRVRDVFGAPSGQVLEALVRGVFSSGEPSAIEFTRTVRGARRSFAAEVRLMPTYEDEAERVTMMIRDVTEQRRMQAKLLETERLASVGLLAAGVAHEVNNPLAYTLLNLERIQNGLRELARNEGSKAASLLDAARMSLEGGRRVQMIINDLRRFSRSDHAELRVPLDVRHVLDFAIHMSSHQVEPRAKLVREFGDVPPVLASEGRLSQVFLNLIVNAAQAIHPGAPDRNEIRVVTRTDERKHAVIDFSDTGEGMTAVTKEHIFEPFFTTKVGEGTGLGLAISQGIVLSLGGQLTVESEPGRGSTFRLIFPPAQA